MKHNSSLKTKKVWVVCGHPDDEVLGCGGTIAKLVDKGNEVRVLIAAEGETSRQETRNKKDVQNELNSLIDSARKANKILGTEKIDFLNLPDNRLDSIDRLDLIKKLEAIKTEYEPDEVYVHHIGDVNIDHRRLHEAIVTACRPFPGQNASSLLSYEVNSSTEWQTPGSGPMFQPNYFVDISDQLERKIKALQCYNQEIRNWPHARSCKAVEYLARWRGSQIGVKAAEAFCLLRCII